MNKAFVIVVSIITLAGILYYVRKIVGNIRLYKLLNGLRLGKFEDVEIQALSMTSRLVLSPFSINQVLLQKAILQNDTEDVIVCINNLEKLRLTEEMKKTIYLEAFNYFVPQNDKHHAKQCYDKLMSLNGYSETKQTTTYIYKIIFEKDTSSLEPLEEKLKQATGQEKAAILGLISVIYQNKGDQKKYQEYQSKAKQTLLEK